MKNHIELYRALLSGRTIMMKDKHTPLCNVRFARIYQGLVCIKHEDKYIPMTAQFTPEDWEMCLEDGHFIECDVSTSRRSLFPAKIYEQLNADPKSVWKCTLERVK